MSCAKGSLSYLLPPASVHPAKAIAISRPAAGKTEGLEAGQPTLAQLQDKLGRFGELRMLRPDRAQLRHRPGSNHRCRIGYRQAGHETDAAMGTRQDGSRSELRAQGRQGLALAPQQSGQYLALQGRKRPRAVHGAGTWW